MLVRVRHSGFYLESPKSKTHPVRLGYLMNLRDRSDDENLFGNSIGCFTSHTTVPAFAASFLKQTSHRHIDTTQLLKECHPCPADNKNMYLSKHVLELTLRPTEGRVRAESKLK